METITNITTKKCKHCALVKPVDDFQRAGKYRQPYCKPCDAERKKKHSRDNPEKVKARYVRYRSENKEAIATKAQQYYQENKEAVLAYHKEYSKKNKEMISAKGKAFREANADHVKNRSKQWRLRNHEDQLKKESSYRQNRTPEQKEKAAKYKREWEQRNKDVIKEKYRDRKRKNRRDWCNNKSATDPAFRILKNLRARIRFALKRDGASKLDTTEKMLGCTIPVFKEYFESLFTEGMTWEAFMNGQIHIDHIIPCSHYDLTKEEEQRACFSYRNLQPLWQADNLKKSNKL